MSNADTPHRVFSLMDEQDFDAIRDLVAPDFEAILGNTTMGFEEWAGMSGMMYSAFPDGRHTIQETFEVGDRIFLRGSFTGTHTGDFMGMPATGKQITITFMNFDRFTDGNLVEHRAEADMLGLMQQIGVNSNAAVEAS